jgi:hypothetical protein
MRSFAPVLIAAAVSLASFALLAQGPPGGGAPKAGGKAHVNLKVLPDDANLIPAMRAFEAALGTMECNFCHDPAQGAGKESDANPRKLKARMMITMAKNINKSFGDGKEHVTCYTCHRGANTPLTVAPN